MSDWKPWSAFPQDDGIRLHTLRQIADRCEGRPADAAEWRIDVPIAPALSPLPLLTLRWPDHWMLQILLVQFDPAWA